MRRLRFALFRWLLLPAMGVLALRLPPGQDLLAVIVEAALSGALQADVEIGRLRSNLWDEVRLQEVTVRRDTALVLRLDRLALQMKSGPPFGTGPSWIAVEGVVLRTAGTDDFGANRERERQPTDADLRRWLPDALYVRDVAIASTADDGDRTGLRGWLTVLRQADAAGGVANLSIEGDSLRLGPDSRQLPVRLDGSIAVGRRWAEATMTSLFGDGVDLQIHGAYEAGAFHGRAHASGSATQFSQLLPEVVRAQLDGLDGHGRLSASAHGLLSDPLVHFDVGLHSASVRDVHIDSAVARGTWAAGQAWLDTVIVDGAPGYLSGHARLSADGPDSGRAHEGQLNLRNVDLMTVQQLLATGTSTAASWSGRMSGTVTWRGRTLAELPLDAADVDVELTEARLHGVAVGPAHVQFDWNLPAASGVVTTALGRLRFAGKVQSLSDHTLQWRVDGLDLRPLQALASVAPVEGAGEIQATSSGSLRRPGIEARASLRGLRIGGLALARLHAGGSIDTAGAFTLSITDGGPRQHLLASGNLSRRALHLATLSIGGTDVSRYLAGSHRQLWSGKLTASLDLQGDLDRPQAVGTFHLDNLGLRGQELGDIQWQVQLADGQAEVWVAALDSSVRLHGSIDLETAGLPVRLQGGIIDAQLRPFLALLTNEPLGYQGTLRARLRLQGLLLDPRMVDADIGLQALQVTTPEGQLALQRPALATLRQGTVRLQPLDFAGSAGSMQVQGSVASDGPLDLHYQLDDLGLDFLEPFIQERAIGLAGRLQGRLDLLGTSHDPHVTGEIAITDVGALGLHFGDLQGQVSYARGALHLQQLDLLLPGGGRLHGQARGPMRLPIAGMRGADRRVDYEAKLELADAVLNQGQGLSDSVRATISGSVQVAGGSLNLADLTGRLDLTRLELARGPYLLASDRALAVTLTAGHLVVADSASFIVVNGTRPDTRPVPVGVTGRTADRHDGLRVATTGADLEVLAQVFGSDRQVQGAIDMDLRLRGPLSEPDLTLTMMLPAGRVDSFEIADLRAGVHFGAGELSLTQLRATLAGGEVEMAGRIVMDGDNVPGHLQLALEAADVDLAPLRVSVPALRDNLDHLSGRLSGELRLEGQSNEPAFSGTLAVANGAVGIVGMKPRLRFDRAMALLSQDSLQLSGLQDPGGRWEVTAVARLHAGGVRDFDAALHLRELRFDMPETMALTTTGHLRWAGSPANASIRGALVVTDGHITEDMSLRTLAFSSADSGAASADSARMEPDAQLQAIELAVTLEGRNLLVDNELARMPFAADLVLYGTAARPVLEGELVAREGYVRYLGQEFSVEHARFLFDKGRPLDDVYLLFHDPARLNPTVDFASATQVKARNGNEYDISLGLSGSFRTIDFHLTSDPPESEMDVLSLLRFGRTGVPMLDARGGMLTTQANLSPDYLLSMTESNFSRVLGLDNVQIDNSVLNPGRLAGSRIVLTKQLGKRTEMTYSTTVGYAAEGRVQLQYDLGHNVFVQTQHDARGESGVDVNLKLKFR